MTVCQGFHLISLSLIICEYDLLPNRGADEKSVAILSDSVNQPILIFVLSSTDI